MQCGGYVPAPQAHFFSEIKGKEVIDYLDDLLIFAETTGKLLQIIQSVLQILLGWRLTPKNREKLKNGNFRQQMMKWQDFFTFVAIAEGLFRILLNCPCFSIS